MAPAASTRISGRMKRVGNTVHPWVSMVDGVTHVHVSAGGGEGVQEGGSAGGGEGVQEGGSAGGRECRWEYRLGLPYAYLYVHLTSS